MAIQQYPAASSNSTALPYGATTALFAGQSTNGTYTYTTSIPAGTYAVGVDSLGSTVDNYVVSTTTNNQSLTIPNGERKYITLSSAVSDLTFTPQGVLPNTTTGTKYFSVLQTGAGYGIEYGNGKYVATTNQTDGIETSTDAYSWTVATTNGYRAPGTGMNVWYNSTVGNWTVVGAGSVHTSTDAVTWTNKDIGGGFLGTGGTSSNEPKLMCSGELSNNYYYALGQRGHYSVSTNGTTWQHLTGVNTSNNAIKSGAFGNNTFITGSNSGKINLLTTTEAWSYRYPGWGTTVFATIFGNGLFVAAGQAGNLSTSTDGNVWTLKTSGFGSTIIRGLEYGNGIYVAVGDTGQLRTSTDATTWTTRTSNFGSTTINAVAYGGGVYVAVGNAATLTSSTDAITWTARTSQFGTSIINAVAYGNGIFVAVGEGGRTTTSTNGTTWTAQTSGTTSILYAVKYHNTRWVATGASGVIRTSTDAVTWAAATQTNAISISADINMLASNGTNKLWAGGASGILTLSTDGITFDVRNSVSPFYSESLYSVNLIGGTYYAFGNGKRYSSTDGITWNPTAVSYTSGNINSYVVYNGTNYVARSVTNNYTMAYSTNGLAWTDGTGLSNTLWVIDGYKMFGTTLVVWGKDNIYAGFIARTTSATIASWLSEALFTTAAYGIDTNYNLFDISDAASGYIGVGNYRYPIYGTSFTTSSWVAKNTTSTAIQSAIGNNIIVTPFNGEITTINTSTNSKTTFDISSYQAGGVAYNPDNTIFVANYNSSNIYNSTDGISWTSTGATPSGGSYYKFVFKNTYFFAAATANATASGAFYYGNTNGSAWTALTAQSGTITTTAVTYGIGAATGTDSRVISCCSEGYLGVISSVQDSINYAQVPGCSGTTFRAATGGNGTLLAVGGPNTIARWAPGQTGWARVSAPFGSTGDIRGVAYSNGIFAAVSASGTLATSTDGVTWTTRTIPSSYLVSSYYDIQPFGNGDFVITGDGIVWKTTKVDSPSAYQFYQTTFSTLA